MDNREIIQFDISKTLEAYHPLYTSLADINFAWGGRDGGKSDNLTRRLMHKCMTSKYFKCILLREVYDTIIESSYEEIKTFIGNNKLDKYFHCTTKPLKITFKPNGNSFIGRGGDKPRKLKGVKNPTDLWAEEADSISMETLYTAIGTLRGSDVKNQAWLTFNPEINPKTGEVDILKNFFEPHNKDITTFYNKKTEWSRDTTFIKNGKEVTETISYLSIHTTIEDNKYAAPSKYAFYESLKGVDDNKYFVWRHGKVGKRENEAPFFNIEQTENFQFVEGVGEIAKDIPLLFSFDFNIKPCTVIICQLNLGLSQEIEPGLHIYETIQVDGGTEMLCNEIMTRDLHMHPSLIEATGDATGRNGNAASLRSSVDIIEQMLHVRFQTPSLVNLEHGESRLVINYWHRHGKTYLYKAKNALLIKDLETGEILRKGGKIKILKNREKHPQDAGDAYRYIFPQWIGDRVKRVKSQLPLLEAAIKNWDRWNAYLKRKDEKPKRP